MWASRADVALVATGVATALASSGYDRAADRRRRRPRRASREAARARAGLRLQPVRVAGGRRTPRERGAAGARAARHSLHRLPARGPQLRAAQGPGEAAPRGGRHSHAAGPRPRPPGRTVRSPVSAHRQAGARGRVGRHLARERRERRRRARSRGRGAGHAPSVNRRWSRSTSTGASSTWPCSAIPPRASCRSARSTSPGCRRACRASSPTTPSGRAGSVDDLGTVPVLHPSLPDAVAARVRRVAADAFRAVGVRDYGRVDVRLAAQRRALSWST